jgi:hypothetical protein
MAAGSCCSGTPLWTCGYAGRKLGPVTGLVRNLPRALRALANDAVVAEDGPHRLAELGAVAARCES